jgi:hypothetical protein
MTFEEQLTRAFETLTDRLRGEIDRQVQTVGAELIAAAPFAPHPTQIDSARAELELAVDAARRQAHQEGYTAGTEAGRGAALDELHARQSETAAPAPDQGLIDAVRSIDRARSLTDILDALLAGASTDSSPAELWLLRGGALHRWRAAESTDGGPASTIKPLDEDSAIAEAVRSNALATSGRHVALPIALRGGVVAVLMTEGRGTPNLELLVRYAARSLEALTAFKTARALTQREASTATAPPAVDDTRGEEDTSALRYARLLVAEIKLYHATAVTEGQRDRDLATRLGGEIARARVMYEQRVPPNVQARVDYFHDELVRTLANGDASLLEFRNQP